jgi:hypothetical protein
MAASGPSRKQNWFQKENHLEVRPDDQNTPSIGSLAPATELHSNDSGTDDS